jgi:hypothetical protein
MVQQLVDRMWRTRRTAAGKFPVQPIEDVLRCGVGALARQRRFERLFEHFIMSGHGGTSFPDGTIMRPLETRRDPGAAGKLAAGGRSPRNPRA